MNTSTYKLSKLYIYSTSISLIILFGYYSHRFLKYYDKDIANHFSYISLIIFSTSIILLMLLFIKFQIKNKIIFLLLFFVLTSSTILSYDFINPTVCTDCESFVMVGKRYREQGLFSFLKNYHKPPLYRFKESPQLYNKFLQYSNKLGLNYKPLFNNIENEPPDITLSDNRKKAGIINFSINYYSPLWFLFIGLWDTFSVEGYFPQIIIPANLIGITFLVSLYFFLGIFYKKEEYRNKLFILFVVLLLPTFFQQVVQNKTVLFLGITVTWLLFFLLKNTENEFNYKDML